LKEGNSKYARSQNAWALEHLLLLLLLITGLGRYIPFPFSTSTSTLLVGRQEGHLACKKLDVGLLVVMFDWSFARLLLLFFFT